MRKALTVLLAVFALTLGASLPSEARDGGRFGGGHSGGGQFGGGRVGVNHFEGRNFGGGRVGVNHFEGRTFGGGRVGVNHFEGRTFGGGGGGRFRGDHFRGDHFRGDHFRGDHFRGGHFHGHGHGGVDVVFGAGFGPWWWDPYPYYYPYYYPSPVVVQSQPDVYVVPEAPTQEYWYYCSDPAGYYPYVRRCPTGWTRMVPAPGPEE